MAPDDVFECTNQLMGNYYLRCAAQLVGGGGGGLTEPASPCWAAGLASPGAISAFAKAAHSAALSVYQHFLTTNA